MSCSFLYDFTGKEVSFPSSQTWTVGRVQSAVLDGSGRIRLKVRDNDTGSVSEVYADQCYTYTRGKR